MTSIDIVSLTGKKSGTVELPADVFDVQVNVPLIHQVVVGQLAAARQGTASTKSRGEVAGGGVAHGPTPRSYEQRTPKKMKAAALRGALSDRARDGRIHVVSALVKGDAPSTKAALAVVDGLSDRKHVLVVIERDNDVAWKSLRNVPRFHLVAPDQLNTYDVLVSDDVVFTKASLDAFLAGPVRGKSVKAVATESDALAAAAEEAAE